MTRGALVIMAKAPLPGQTKTRLAADVGHAAAAALYRCFLIDTIALARRVPEVEVSLFCPGGEHKARLYAALPAEALDGLAVYGQRSRGLMNGLAEALALHLRIGHRRVVLVDADSPTVAPAEVSRAFDLLAEADVVLGPCDDGGYYLVGARDNYPWLFLEEPRDPDRICAQTLESVRRRGLRAETVATWYDVDTLADLERLQRALGRAGDAAPATRRFLAGWSAQHG